jgi:hypothetical protein
MMDSKNTQTCRQKILVKKNVSRIRDSPTGIPYRRKLRYPKFNFILFPPLTIFSIIWVSRFCVCHSKFDWNQFFTKNFIIWQESHTLHKLHLCAKGLTLHKLPFLPDDEILGEKLSPINFTVAGTKPGHPDDRKNWEKGEKNEIEFRVS